VQIVPVDDEEEDDDDFDFHTSEAFNLFIALIVIFGVALLASIIVDCVSQGGAAVAPSTITPSIAQ